MFVLVSFSPEINYSDVKVKTRIEYSEVIKIEYVLIDGQWWKIIYYSDGGIETHAVYVVGD
jgi:hypothetical protein